MGPWYMTGFYKHWQIIAEHIIAAFTDWRVRFELPHLDPESAYRSDLQIYGAGVMYFGVNCAAASLSAFLPTIITTFGFSKPLIPY